MVPEQWNLEITGTIACAGCGAVILGATTVPLGNVEQAVATHLTVCPVARGTA